MSVDIFRKDEGKLQHLNLTNFKLGTNVLHKSFRPVVFSGKNVRVIASYDCHVPTEKSLVTILVDRYALTSCHPL